MHCPEVTVVIRAAGERTEALCRALVLREVAEKDVFVLHERPFARAVRRNFEIGAAQGKPWTLAVDADVLLREGAISQMIERVKNLPSAIRKKTYVYQGRVHCRVFGQPRRAGLHLYQTETLPTALKFVDDKTADIRPESATYTLMQKKGFYHIRSNDLYGLHDYHQSYAALFRNGFFQARKHLSQAGTLLEYWTTEAHDDFRVLLAGWNHSLTTRQTHRLERVGIDEIKALTEQAFQQLNLFEKPPLTATDTARIQQETEEICTVAPRPFQWQRHRHRRVFPGADLLRQTGNQLEKLGKKLQRV